MNSILKKLTAADRVAVENIARKYLPEAIVAEMLPLPDFKLRRHNGGGRNAESPFVVIRAGQYHVIIHIRDTRDTRDQQVVMECKRAIRRAYPMITRITIRGLAAL